jgi:translation initiation factor 3 subunit L
MRLLCCALERTFGSLFRSSLQFSIFSTYTDSMEPCAVMFFFFFFFLLFSDDQDVLVLYKELYYRHIYAKMTPTVDDKFDSFQNYVDLFNLILSLDSNTPTFELPISWLWDLIDEFIYQFQTFHLFRNKVADLTPEEINMLKEHEHMWSAQTVLQYLHALVRKAGIDLNKKASESAPVPAAAAAAVAGEEEKSTGVHSMYRTLGYFSLIGLLRVNALLCDYQSALKCLDPIDLRKNRSLFTGVLQCHVSLYYYMGLSYLMCRRYMDACKVFTYFLTYTQRNKHVISRSNQVELINKRVDQMLGLLGLAFVLSGATNATGSNDKQSGNNGSDSTSQLLDENIFHDLRDKLDDRFTRMRSFDISAFEEVFSSSSPKFLTVSAPNYDAGINVHMDATALQLKQFSNEVKSRQHLHEVYSYLRLFTTCSVSKLSVFLQMDEEHTLALLLKLQHKTYTQRWIGGPPADFVWQHLNEIHFTLKKDIIYVTEQKTTRKYGDFFLRQISKFEDLTQDIKSIKIAQRR